MEITKNVLEIIYYISFIFMTGIITLYTIKSFYNQKKDKAEILSRVNYNFGHDTGPLSITIDLLNNGDYVFKDIDISFKNGYGEKVLPLEKIPYIGAHKLYQYYIGTLNREWTDILWIDGTVTHLQDKSMRTAKIFPKINVYMLNKGHRIVISVEN